ncbi:right-handed parallel beta-helix repeat-containing protein [Polyangium sp. 6x1]|uniref:right-handed parallel beta-helix repeat-containing protein n=1 Tax=Polyangium sp. 6x1 TaxID=3042689 RepID=UPI00248214CC|nr:right-handed parallel beta-helix repeat-containing protein [Polyangium sp. 6x1]MDI1447710.1 right-handed parallel beta-helix repeat-containing protein [Polyangium sp. 6x1]
MNETRVGASIPSILSERAKKTFVVGLFAGAAVISSGSLAHAATYQVGPGKSYPDLASVASRLAPGDVVEVEGDASYPGDVRLRKSGAPGAKITIRGVRKNGKRPVFRGGKNTVQIDGNHYVLEGLDITGGSFRCVFNHADDVTIRDSVVHDCPAHGILGADTESGSLTLQYVEVHHAGEGERKHPIYVATDERMYPDAVFRMEHCYVHDGNGGHNVKSRAGRNEIYSNWIEGAKFHELELIGSEEFPENVLREDSDVVGNVLRKRNDFPVVRLGGDGAGQTNGRYRFVNNTILAGSKAVFRLYDGLESLEAHNNVFFRVGGGAVTLFRDRDAKWSRGHAILGGSNNWITSGSDVPDVWVHTLQGNDPVFVDPSGAKPVPAANSPLRDAGNTYPQSPAAAPFTEPLRIPVDSPPLAGNGSLGRSLGRTDGRIDIGALEVGMGARQARGDDENVGTAAQALTIAGEEDVEVAELGDADAEASDDADVDEETAEAEDELASEEGGMACSAARSARPGASAFLVAGLFGLGLVRARRRKAPKA